MAKYFRTLQGGAHISLGSSMGRYLQTNVKAHFNEKLWQRPYKKLKDTQYGWSLTCKF